MYIYIYMCIYIYTHTHCCMRIGMHARGHVAEPRLIVAER